MKKEALLVMPGQGSFTPENPQDDQPPEIHLLKATLERFHSLRDKFPHLPIGKVLGNSYGLYGALVVTGAITAITAYKLAKARSDLVREAEAKSPYPTAMAALIGVSETDVRDLITPYNHEIDKHNNQLSEAASRIPRLERTNNNGPLTQVIGGTRVYITRLLAERKVRGKVLDIEGAYHHSVRHDESKRYSQIVQDADIVDPEISLISSTDPRVLKSAEDIREELISQMVRPVDLVKAASLWKGNTGLIIDNGPGNAMQKLLTRIDGETPVLSAETDQVRLSAILASKP